MKNQIKLYLESEYTNSYHYFKSLQSAKNFASRCRKDESDTIRIYDKDMNLLCEKIPFSNKWTACN